MADKEYLIKESTLVNIANSIRNIFPSGDGKISPNDMPEFLDSQIDKLVKEERAQARQEGRDEGRDIGYNEGKEEGQREVYSVYDIHINSLQSTLTVSIPFEAYMDGNNSIRCTTVDINGINIKTQDFPIPYPGTTYVYNILRGTRFSTSGYVSPKDSSEIQYISGGENPGDPAVYQVKV